MTLPFDPRKIVLASQSPRRFDLLSQMGFKPVVLSANVNEDLHPDELPVFYVQRLAREKALAAALQSRDLYPNIPLVLGADTTVVLDGEILSKPADEQEALNTLRALSGRAHEVLTGVAILDLRKFSSGCQYFVTSTIVRFAPLDEKTIRHYIATGEPMDKAGAYGIQGIAAAFITAIQGSYSGVVGLPLCETVALIRRMQPLPAFPFCDLKDKVPA